MSTSSSSQAKEQDDDTKPIWTYITKIKSVAGGGNYEIKCNICDFTFNGSYTRVRAHLLKMTGKGVRVCQKVTVAKLIALKKIDNIYSASLFLAYIYTIKGNAPLAFPLLQ